MKAIIHVGDMKAGSKSIQTFLLENRQLLQDAGVYVSEETRVGPYHSMLCSYAFDDSRMENNPRREWGITDISQMEEHRHDVHEKIKNEVANLEPGTHSVVFSHEGLLSLDGAEVARVMQLLRTYFSEIRIVAYIRRQDKHFVSMWGQRINSGQSPGPNFFQMLRNSRSYVAMLANWEQAVGLENLAVRVLESKSFLNGNLYQDFCAAAGIPWNDQFEQSNASNVGLNPVAQTFLIALNQRLAAKGVPTITPRSGVIPFLQQYFTGNGTVPSRAWALETVEFFAKENEEICRRYFPDQTSLFDDNFDSYPINGTPPCTAAEAFDLAVTMWEHFHQGPTELEVRQAYRLILGRAPTPDEVATQTQANASVKGLYMGLLRSQKKPLKETSGK